MHVDSESYILQNDEEQDLNRKEDIVCEPLRVEKKPKNCLINDKIVEKKKISLQDQVALKVWILEEILIVLLWRGKEEQEFIVSALIIFFLSSFAHWFSSIPIFFKRAYIENDPCSWD